MSAIPLQNLKDMFANMRAQTNWNLDGDMLWGYYFTDSIPEKLESLAEKLSDSGYRLVKIYPTDDNSTCVLHVECAEKHTPESLQVRNGELEGLAREFGVESYDGMDVGPLSAEGSHEP